MYLTLGLVTALAVILARTQSRLIDSIQKLFTLIATGLLPLVSLLTLMFIHHSAVYGPERDFSPHLRRRVAVNAGLFAIDLNGYCPQSAKSVTSLDGAVALPD